MLDDNEERNADDSERLRSSFASRRLPFLRRCLRITLLVFLVLAVCGFAWDQIATRMFLANNPPPGEIVNVNDVDFHLLTLGDRRPGDAVLVVEPGLGDGVLEWLHLAEECSSFTQIVIADRRGQGFSSGLSSGSRTPRQNMEDLRAILNAKGIEPPYVVAGHSLGGLNARVFQSLYPDSVVGMVLIDALTLDHINLDEVPTPPFFAVPLTMTGRFGLLRLLGWRGEDLGRLPEQNLDVILGQRARGTYYTNLLNQWNGVLEGRYDTQKLLTSTCEIPLTVVSAKGVGDAWLRHKEGQELLQHISPYTTTINLDCHHSVQLVRHKLVVDELRSMMERVTSHERQDFPAEDHLPTD